MALLEETLNDPTKGGPLRHDGLVSAVMLEYFLSRICMVRCAVLWSDILEFSDLRPYQARRQQRLRLAEYWHDKLVVALEHCESPMVAEQAASLFFKTGRHDAGQSKHDVTVDWLEKACRILRGQKSGELSTAADNLQVIILQNLVRAWMHLPSEDAKSKATRICEDLCTKFGDKSTSSILRLDLLEHGPTLVSKDYINIVLRLVHTTSWNGYMHEIFLQHFRKLRSGNAMFAHTILEVLLQISNSTAERNPAFVERILITLIWDVTTSTDSTNGPKLLEGHLDAMKRLLPHPIAVDGSNAAQVVSTNASLYFFDCALTVCEAIVETYRVKLQGGEIC